MSKIINNETEIYFITNKKSNVLYGKVYLDKQKAQNNCNYHKCREDKENLYIDSIIVPFVGKNLYFIHLYKGFDYGMSDIHDIYFNTNLYPSIESIKQNETWNNYYQKAKDNPEKFNIYDDRICSKDIFREDWLYGDVMESNINLKIIKVKVIR